MHLVGELRDHKMILLMKEELSLMEIASSIYHDEKKDIYFLSVHDALDLERAKDYFRLKMGFKKPMVIDEEWVKIKTLPRGEISFSIIILCTVLYLLSYTEIGARFFRLMYIGGVETGFLYEVIHGQIWRLITPIFIHLSVLHILFNMLWFKDLSYIIEYRFGKNTLLILIFSTGIFSNLLQYFVNGPQFGGMSGVLYAMLGFIWAYKKISPDFDYALPKRDIAIMIFWLFLCLTGLLGPIANSAHAGGLFLGVLTALLKSSSKWGRVHFKYIFLATLILTLTIGIEGLKLKGHYYVLLWAQN